jgi:hypothetical protein
MLLAAQRRRYVLRLCVERLTPPAFVSLLERPG